MRLTKLINLQAFKDLDDLENCAKRRRSRLIHCCFFFILPLYQQLNQKGAATFRRRIAALFKAQVGHGGNFALYGSPVSLIWDVQRAPELKRCIEDWHLTEFRWCNMGVVHPETGQGFGSKTKVLSSKKPTTTHNATN